MSTDCELPSDVESRVRQLLNMDKWMKSSNFPACLADARHPHRIEGIKIASVIDVLNDLMCREKREDLIQAVSHGLANRLGHVFDMMFVTLFTQVANDRLRAVREWDVIIQLGQPAIDLLEDISESLSESNRALALELAGECRRHIQRELIQPEEHVESEAYDLNVAARS